MPRDENEARRRWAEDRIAELKAQRRGIDEAVRRYEDFLSLLTQSNAALRASATVTKSAAVPKLGKRSPLVDYLQAALAQSGPAGIPVDEISQKVAELGYKPKGKTTVRVMVSTELARRVKLPGSRIVRVDKGRYALAEQRRQLELGEPSGG